MRNLAILVSIRPKFGCFPISNIDVDLEPSFPGVALYATSLYAAGLLLPNDKPIFRAIKRSTGKSSLELKELDPGGAQKFSPYWKSVRKYSVLKLCLPKDNLILPKVGCRIYIASVASRLRARSSIALSKEKSGQSHFSHGEQLIRCIHRLLLYRRKKATERDTVTIEIAVHSRKDSQFDMILTVSSVTTLRNRSKDAKNAQKHRDSDLIM